MVATPGPTMVTVPLDPRWQSLVCRAGKADRQSGDCIGIEVKLARVYELVWNVLQR